MKGETVMNQNEMCGDIYKKVLVVIPEKKKKKFMYLGTGTFGILIVIMVLIFTICNTLDSEFKITMRDIEYDRLIQYVR